MRDRGDHVAESGRPYDQKSVQGCVGKSPRGLARNSSHRLTSMPLSLQQVLALNRQLGRGFDAAGNPRLFSDREFFDISSEMGLNQRNADYRRLHESLATWIRNALFPSSALEIGSGPGYLLYCLNRLGIDATGVDGNLHSKAFFDACHPEYADRYVIDRYFEAHYARVDALVSIEAFEHIPDEGLGRILEKVRRDVRPRYFVFSSTPHHDPNPGWDLQWGHINIKQPAQWHLLFSEFGYRPVDVRPPVTEWATLYIDSFAR